MFGGQIKRIMGELVYQNYETPAMLVSQTNPVGDHSFLM